MVATSPLDKWSLADLASRCALETERFMADQASDPRYCFELFRRAIALRDERAWGLIWARYRDQVVRWVERHPSFHQASDEAQWFANRAFERMWSALTARPFAFGELKQVLRYLQMCVHSVIMDHLRAAEHATLSAQAELPESLAERDPPVERQALDHLQREALWREVCARLHSPEERCVIYGSYVLGLKPREIVDLYPKVIASVGEVYRLKENVLDRLRRDQTLAESLRSA